MVPNVSTALAIAYNCVCIVIHNLAIYMEFNTLEEALEAFKELEAKYNSVQSTAEKRKTERIEAEKKAAELAKRLEGVDPEEYAALKEAAEKRRIEDLEAKGKFDELTKEKDDLIAKLQAKIKGIEQEKEQAIASSMQRERNFHLAQEFIKSGGIPEQLDNFLLVGGNLFNYEVDQETKKGILKPAETLLGEDNKQIIDAGAALKHFAQDARYGVFFHADNNSSSGTPNGSAPPPNTSSALDGKVWV